VVKPINPGNSPVYLSIFLKIISIPYRSDGKGNLKKLILLHIPQDIGGFWGYFAILFITDTRYSIY